MESDETQECNAIACSELSAICKSTIYLPEAMLDCVDLYEYLSKMFAIDMNAVGLQLGHPIDSKVPIECDGILALTIGDIVNALRQGLHLDNVHIFQLPSKIYYRRDVFNAESLSNILATERKIWHNFRTAMFTILFGDAADALHPTAVELIDDDSSKSIYSWVQPITLHCHVPGETDGYYRLSFHFPIGHVAQFVHDVYLTGDLLPPGWQQAAKFGRVEGSETTARECFVRNKQNTIGVEAALLLKLPHGNLDTAKIISAETRFISPVLVDEVKHIQVNPISAKTLGAMFSDNRSTRRAPNRRRIQQLLQTSEQRYDIHAPPLIAIEVSNLAFVDMAVEVACQAAVEAKRKNKQSAAIVVSFTDDMANFQLSVTEEGEEVFWKRY